MNATVKSIPLDGKYYACIPQGYDTQAEAERQMQLMIHHVFVLGQLRALSDAGHLLTMANSSMDKVEKILSKMRQIVARNRDAVDILPIPGTLEFADRVLDTAYDFLKNMRNSSTEPSN